MGKNLFPILSGNIIKIVFILVGASIPFLGVSYFVFPLSFTKGFAISLVMAYLDIYVALFGIKKALAFASEPHKGLATFHKYTFIRVVNIAVMFFLLSKVLRLKDYASGLCVGFLLIHILLFIYLVLITRSKGSVEKGE